MNPAGRGTTTWRKQIREQLAALYGCRCVWCGYEFRTPQCATIEHLVPVEHGGTRWIGNLRLACEACNHDRNVWYSIATGKMKRKKRKIWSSRLGRYVPRDEFLSGCPTAASL